MLEKDLEQTAKDNSVVENPTNNEQTETVSVERDYKEIEYTDYAYDDVKELKSLQKQNAKLIKKYSKEVLDGAIISTTKTVPNTDENIIELKNVRKAYSNKSNTTPVLKGIDLEIKKGKVVIILGPSGSGKTTLLNVISGLDKVDAGDIFVSGHNLLLLKDSHLTKFRRDNVGFIFQQYNLLQNLTARENTEIGENLNKRKNKGFKIEEIFDLIGMAEQIDKYPHQMSGGQQQRVSIARAIAKNPKILFGDEPTGALDEEMGKRVLEILIDVNRKFNTTVIIVTHNPNIAKIGDQIIHVANGRIGSNELNSKPMKPADIDWS
ncbi:ABC transporter ATP-binding protein [Spiroplasma sp. TIUS-1]|uniref:ABC transporter ATP-binding protein n=1 Tax=Spiroplasma sp. TIUS-1 TaxID=216963 RepID=UPI0013983039|nr:ATP-binding cassette domain-containing protein [Spiroplasma sp. TIUS-1]QHX35570.1 ABC transporter ATP-binding protein [Spiroplasma sp. TIUS-1]